MLSRYGCILSKVFHLLYNDYSQYMYLYLLNSKNEALYAFKVFKAEVEKQYGKQIKIVRSDRGGEYLVDTLRINKHPVLLQSFLLNMGLLPNIPHLVL